MMKQLKHRTRSLQLKVHVSNVGIHFMDSNDVKFFLTKKVLKTVFAEVNKKTSLFKKFTKLRNYLII